MKYEYAPDLQMQAEDISRALFPHIKMDSVKCFRSFGTSSRGTIARCHALGKLMQKAIGVRPFYVLEFLSERFDKLSDDEKIKVLIHELMHIPKSFGGGFKHHDFVCEKNIKQYYKAYMEIKKRGENERKKSWF
ncbi:MAG: putative metallopeptidase [Nanoarchaeota archaeon]